MHRVFAILQMRELTTLEQFVRSDRTDAYAEGFSLFHVFLTFSTYPFPCHRPSLPPTLQGGKYCEFAGHDITRRAAKGLGTAENNGHCHGYDESLDDLSLEDLERFERMTIDGWENTFIARGYPLVGRVITPPAPRRMVREELRPFDGRGLGEGALPEGYGTVPIYMGVKDRVFDVSFGGSEFYTNGGAYECLAGQDASRVLAKMSMEREDVEGVLDYSVLTDRERKNIDDWVEKLGEGGKGYPVVGWIDLDSL